MSGSQLKPPALREFEATSTTTGKARPRQVSQMESPAAAVMRFQQTLGNQAVQRMLGALMIQTKLTVNEPGDQYEQEADRVAGSVMRVLESPQPEASSAFSGQGEIKVQRMCADCEKEKDLHTKRISDSVFRQGEGAAEAAPEVESAIDQARGGGSALDSAVQRQMGAAFGADFSGVRVHTDGQADTLNRSVSAVAFTTGQDIFFRQGAYSPESSSGKQLLAHELTHVVQQNGASILSPQHLQRACPGPDCEEDKNKQ